MNKIKRKLFLTCTTLGFTCLTLVSLISNAQEQTHNNCTDQPNTTECRQSQPTKFQAGREANWHNHLKITAAQEPAWQAFIASLRQKNKSKGGSYESDKSSQEEIENLSAPEHLEKVLAKMEKRQAALRAHLIVLKGLYATLTPEQQTLLDKRLRQLHRKHHGAHSDHQ